MYRHARSTRLPATALALLLGLAACSDGGSKTTPVTTDFSGLVSTSDGRIGELALTIQGAVPAPPAPAGLAENRAGVNASGTLTFPGAAAIPLSGSFSAGSYTASGGGYALSGTAAAAKLTGTVTGPGGITGSVAGGSGSGVSAFCGAFAGTVDAAGIPDFGSFSTVSLGATSLSITTTATGIVLPYATTNTGTSFATDATIPITFLGTSGSVHLVNSGTLNTTNQTIAGSYTTDFNGAPNSAGSFAGGPCGTGAAATPLAAVSPAIATVAVGFGGLLVAVPQGFPGALPVLGGPVAWTSSDPAVATVSALGGYGALVTGVAPGSATITGQLPGGTPVSATVTVL